MTRPNVNFEAGAASTTAGGVWRLFSRGRKTARRWTGMTTWRHLRLHRSPGLKEDQCCNYRCEFWCPRCLRTQTFPARCGRRGRGCCNMFQIVLFVVFLVSLPGLTTAAPPLIMGGAWVCLRQHIVCVHSFKWCFYFFVLLPLPCVCSCRWVVCHRSG